MQSEFIFTADKQTKQVDMKCLDCGNQWQADVGEHNVIISCPNDGKPYEENKC